MGQLRIRTFGVAARNIITAYSAEIWKYGR